MGQPATLEALRQRIQQIEGRPAGRRELVSSGTPPVEGGLGGLPRPGIVSLVGELGSGRTRLVLSWAAARMRQGERIAWVDPLARLYPPAVAEAGVALDRLLLVRPEEPQVGWATEQLVRSGCFGMVVLSDPPDVPSPRRWKEATWRGHTTLVVLTERPVQVLPADVRLDVRAGEARVRRRRGGPAGQRVVVPRATPRLELV